MAKPTNKIKINVDKSEVDEIKTLVDELNSSLEKANSLLDELASKKNITIKTTVMVGGEKYKEFLTRNVC